MIDIKPFKALLPDKELVNEIQAPPYDVISTADAKKQAGEYSILKITKPEINENTNNDNLYQVGAKILEQYIKNNVLIYDEKDNFYIYQIETDTLLQTGLVALSSCKDYENNIIKKHELTRKDKELDRINLISTLKAQTGPVFLTFNSKDKNQEQKDLLEKLTKNNKSLFDIKIDNQIHSLFKIEKQEEIKNISDNFSKTDCLYIADGHHRAKAAYEVNKKLSTGKSGYFLSIIFPSTQLKILSYNRVIKNTIKISINELFEKLKPDFEVIKQEYKKPEDRNYFSLYYDNNWYYIKINRKGTNNPVEDLTTQILQSEIFDKIFGIKNPRTDKNIDFIGGVYDKNYIENYVKENNFDFGFELYPTSIDELISISDNNLLMPPKSTWFEPKLRSGVLIYKF